VLRFELSGQGGGNYNLVLFMEEVAVLEGRTKTTRTIILNSGVKTPIVQSSP